MGDVIRITAGDGKSFDAYRARPAGTPRAGLVIVQEIFGVNKHMRSVVDGYAQDGYLALAPALFDRAEAKVELGYDEDGFTKGRALRAKIPWDRAVGDIAAAAEEVSSAGKVGVVGYCWGGSLAWLAACRLSIDAAVCYYGGQIHDYRAEQPSCPVLMHFGETDQHIPLEHVEVIRQTHPGIPIHIYPAGHGFNCGDRADFDAQCARIARERSLAFLAEHLG